MPEGTRLFSVAERGDEPRSHGSKVSDFMADWVEHRLETDAALRARARRVIPGGMYGHQSVAALPKEFPQFMARGVGSHVWDVDGNEYVDLMCGYGPVLVGHRHPRVEEAAEQQAAEADCQNGPSARMVELAEALTHRVQHADWALFAKNGTDATTQCVTISRAETGRRKVLMAADAYHGAAPWCTHRGLGILPEDQAHFLYFRYNDLASVEAAASKAGDDLAGVLVSPIRHDLGVDQELPDPAFASGIRRVCDRAGAVLILDDVRCGFRLSTGSSWEPLGIAPDLSAWSKAIANGYSLAAVLGRESLADAASSIFTTGSFWFSAVSMAASLATIDVLEDEGTLEHTVRAGTLLHDGLSSLAREHDVQITLSGPVQMPFLTFVGDQDFTIANEFSRVAIMGGVWLHPRHNWFLSGALTDADVAKVLEVANRAFTAAKTVQDRFLEDGASGGEDVDQRDVDQETSVLTQTTTQR